MIDYPFRFESIVQNKSKERQVQMIRQAEKRNLVADKSISLNSGKLFERICNI